MKRYRIGRAALATMMSLALGLGVTACSRDYTVAYVYATSAQGGGVSAFGVDYQSGQLVQIAGSPFTSNLFNPVTLVVSPDNKNLYVIGGSQDNKLLHMGIGTDGKLYGQDTYDINGLTPTAAAIDPSGSFLFVTFKMQNIYTTVSPGPGGVTIFPIHSDGTLGTSITQNLGNNPAGVAIGGLQACNTSTVITGTTCSTLPAPCQDYTTAPSSLCHLVYIVDADTSSTGTGQGQILGFIQTGTDGTLTPLPGTVITDTPGTKTVATGYTAGVTPTAIAADPASHYIYVTDRAQNYLLAYQVGGPSTPTPGALTPLQGNNPENTGQYPVGMTIDPRGLFLYVANYGASTVSAYALYPDGHASAVAGTGNGGTTSTGPTCVTIEPALGIYLYTSNQLSGQISGMQLDPHTGALSNIQNTPFDASPQLSCAASAANGDHATSLITP